MDPVSTQWLHRLWSAGFFGGAAALVGIALLVLWALKKQRACGTDCQSVLPVIVIACLTWTLWLSAAVALFFEGFYERAWILHACELLALLITVVPMVLSGRAWLLGPALALLGIGALVAPAHEAGFWLSVLALAAIFVLLLIFVLTGQWWSPVGYAIGAAALLALGGWMSLASGEGLAVAASNLGSMQFVAGDPWWLLLLLLIPLIFAMSFRSLAGLGPVRRWVAIGLRCALILFLTLALAKLFLRHGTETVTVLFVWDRSFSIPEEPGPDNKDQREARIRKFINDAVEKRRPARQRDQAGVIVFGRWPRVELPPASVPKFNLQKVVSRVDETQTDIAAALKLALASFPEGTGKRIVLISDGNENLGQAKEQAEIAKQNGVQIDVVPLAIGRRSRDEVLVEWIETPPVSVRGSVGKIRVLLRSYSRNIVVGDLKILKASLEKRSIDPKLSDQFVFADQTIVDAHGIELPPWPEPLLLEKTIGLHDESSIYEVIFIPKYIKNKRGEKIQNDVPGDRIENNRATSTMVARGKRHVLFLEPNEGDHHLLVERLQKAKKDLTVITAVPEMLPKGNPGKLARLLSEFDCVILANVPADSFTPDQQQVIRSNTHDQGCGLIMIGGRQSFGAGGWQETEIEKALPVTCDLKAMDVAGKSGLVLIMHASEIAEGNMHQKKIAKLAIDKLSSLDMLGMLYFDWQGGPGQGADHIWHIPFQQIKGNKQRLYNKVDTMNPGDMPDAAPSLQKAYDALTDPQHQLGTKHIIFISDGDHWTPPVPLLVKIRNAKITCTTVCVTSHGQGEYQNMAKVAQITGGRSYPRPQPDGSYVALDPQQLPAIYIRETRLISQSFIYDKTFQPEMPPAARRRGPTEGMPDPLPNLHGFVRTTPRNNPLVNIPVWSDKQGDSHFPVLAYWQYGLGKSVAFTSDALTRDVVAEQKSWDRTWASKAMHAKFWEQVVEWSLRPTDASEHMTMTAEHRGGKIHVVLKARDKDKNWLTNLKLDAGVSSPSMKVQEHGRPPLKFEQKNAGIYEAEFPADEVGSYFINVRATQKDKDYGSVRVGVTVPYSPEFAEMESNPSLLEELRKKTGGQSYAEDAASLAEVVHAGEIFRPSPVRSKSLQAIWFWLVVLTGIALFFDVATRRIALEPAAVAAQARELFDTLRGRVPAAAATPQFLDRLKSRKAEVGEALHRTRAERRFDGAEGPVVAPPIVSEGLPAAPRPQPRPTATPRVGPDKEAEAQDYASRLLRAKKRAMEERDKEE